MCFFVAHLYSQQEEIVYDYVFVRVVFDLDVLFASHWRSGSGAAATTRIAISGCICHPIALANSGSFANSARADVNADIQRSPLPVDWSSVYFRPRSRFRS
jgi:hypothetical protein